MFGLFNKKVKVATFSGRKGNVTVTLTNKKSYVFDIGSTTVEQVIDVLKTEGMHESQVKDLTSMYNKYVETFGTGNEETYTLPSVYHEDLVNAKLAEIKKLLSSMGKEESDVNAVNAISINRDNVCDDNNVSSDEVRATSQEETKAGQEEPAIAEEAVVVGQDVELVNVVPTPTITVNEDVIEQITRIVESDMLDIKRISEVLVKAGDAGVSKEGFTFKLSETDGDIVIEKDGVENWDIEAVSAEEKSRVLDILKDIE